MSFDIITFAIISSMQHGEEKWVIVGVDTGPISHHDQSSDCCHF